MRDGECEGEVLGAANWVGAVGCGAEGSFYSYIPLFPKPYGGDLLNLGHSQGSVYTLRIVYRMAVDCSRESRKLS
jgi:hypothetical protein